jgi:hypothetical protein
MTSRQATGAQVVIGARRAALSQLTDSAARAVEGDRRGGLHQPEALGALPTEDIMPAVEEIDLIAAANRSTCRGAWCWPIFICRGNSARRRSAFWRSQRRKPGTQVDDQLPADTSPPR